MSSSSLVAVVLMMPLLAFSSKEFRCRGTTMTTMKGAKAKGVLRVYFLMWEVGQQQRQQQLVAKVLLHLYVQQQLKQ
jgi:hypothetical protein